MSDHKFDGGLSSLHKDDSDKSIHYTKHRDTVYWNIACVAVNVAGCPDHAVS